MKSIILLLVLFSIPAQGDVFDNLLEDPMALPVELQKKLEHKEPDEQKKILKTHYTHISRQLEAALTHGLYATKTAHRLGAKEGDVFTPERKQLHEEIIQNFLGKGDEKQPISNKKPKLIIIAGAPGAGKSTVVNRLESQNLFNKKDFVYLDPDEIRAKLPEYRPWTEKFAGKDSEMLEKISQLTQAEANYLTDEIYARALQQRKNIVRDGTMRNVPFFSKVISDASIGGYETGILHVDVAKPTALARVESRAKETGRKVNRDFFDIANPEIINTSAKYLKRLSNFYIKINNEVSPEVEDCGLNFTCSDTNVTFFASKFKKLNPATDENVKALLDKLTCVPSQPLSKTRVPIEELKTASNSMKSCVSILITNPVEEPSSSDGCKVKTPADEIMPENQLNLPRLLKGC